MVANESWMYQGRQEHGWFGRGTSPHDKTGDAAENPNLFRPENAANRVVYVASSIVGHAPRADRRSWTTTAISIGTFNTRMDRLGPSILVAGGDR